MPILQRLAQPFNELDDLTVFSEVFEPFLERSLGWQIKLRERFVLENVYPNHYWDYRADRSEAIDCFYRGVCHTRCS